MYKRNSIALIAMESDKFDRNDDASRRMHPVEAMTLLFDFVGGHIVPERTGRILDFDRYSKLLTSLTHLTQTSFS